MVIDTSREALPRDDDPPRAGALARRAHDSSGPGAHHLRHGGLQRLQTLARQADAQDLLRPDSGKYLHYYLYFQDAEVCLVYLRVPTWAPFRLQCYCNGLSWLARKLTAQGIGYTMADNAFVRVGPRA